MKDKYVLIGAGSVVFTRGLVASLLKADQAAEIALVDIDPHALEVADRLTRKMAAARNRDIKVSASTDHRDVLPGATVVITTIGVGGRTAWARDVEIPRRHGVYVAVGDTVGPGGASRALRMIPAMVRIAKDVVELAPTALFFNYGNPLGPVVRAIYKATGAPVVGLCHGVHNSAGFLAKKLGVARESLEYVAVGRNHLTWFTSVRVGRRDMMPELRAVATRECQLAAGRGESDKASWPGVDSEQNPFSWRLLLEFGAFPAPGDRHVTEFFPQFFRNGTYYGMTLGVDSDAFSFEETIARGNDTFARMEGDAFSPAPLSAEYLEEIRGEHEQVVEIVDSIRNDRSRVYSANLPNRGAIPGVDDDAIVEAPAVAAPNGMRLLPQTALPAQVMGTLSSRWQWDEVVVDAAIRGDRQRFVQSLVLDGNVPSIEAATAVADELIGAQAEHLAGTFQRSTG